MKRSGLSMVVAGFLLMACGTAQDSGESFTTDQERMERIDSLSVVKSDSIKMQQRALSAPSTAPASKRENK